MLVIDIIGKRFNRLTVIEATHERKWGGILYKCICDCGNELLVAGADLNRKNTQSCGCLQKDAARNNIINGKYFQSTMFEGTNISLLNSKIPSSNTSGVKGVTWSKKANKWKAQIGFQNKTIYLGLFSNVQEAADARKAAEQKYFKPILEKYSK
ncbi:hypothetical protein IGI37_002274 [Enterococcus sp. AZ194]|uniref:hypothetical protein n=1 Tax=Enterococcus sp. AZ194 TaxID=2774629 RepID=UPI003F2417C5